jgi:hypothetical protein
VSVRQFAPTLLMACALVGGHAARAEPYLAVQQGYKCVQCHVNPTGAGLRNEFGAVFSQNVMAARPLPEGWPAWDGKLGDVVRVGGNLREAWTRTDIQDQDAIEDWELQEVRFYGGLDAFTERLSLVLDMSFAQDEEDVRQAYAQWWGAERGWYAKAGRFFLPFGWRVQDDGAFVRQVSDISRTGFRDYEGVEVGLETAEWSAQLAVTTEGDIAGPDGDTGSGTQVTAQAVWVQPRGRLGVAAALADADAGDRTLGTIFGGLRTGPVAWLGEIDLVRNEAYPDGTRNLVAALAEADWAVAKGHNLRLSGEWLEPDSGLDDDELTRWSLVYEYTPIAFVQFRAGARLHDANPQNDPDNRSVVFVELHGFF